MKRLSGYCHFLLALLMFAALPRAKAVVLLDPIELLTLFEIEGIDFAFYSSSKRITIHFEDTSDGFMDDVELRGQTDRRTDLTFLAVSLHDPRQQVALEIDVGPLRGPPHEGLTFLQSRPLPTDPPPPTDRALEPFLEPLVFGFRFVSQMPDLETGGTRSEYRLEHVDVPEPSSLALAVLGVGLCLRRTRTAATRSSTAERRNAMRFNTPSAENSSAHIR